MSGLAETKFAYLEPARGVVAALVARAVLDDRDRAELERLEDGAVGPRVAREAEVEPRLRVAEGGGDGGGDGGDSY